MTGKLKDKTTSITTVQDLQYRAGQISTKHLKTSIQHIFSTCRLPLLHKFRRCFQNRHTFFGPSETIGVYISKSFFFKAKIAITKSGIGKRSNWGRCFGLDFFLFPSPPLPLCVGKWRDLVLKLSQRTPPIPRPPPWGNIRC